MMDPERELKGIKAPGCTDTELMQMPVLTQALDYKYRSGLSEEAYSWSCLQVSEMLI